MATAEQFQEMVDAMVNFKQEVAQLKAENAMLMKMQAMGGAVENHGGKRGLIDVRELARMETLEHERQWADWSTRFRDAIMARGHPAARCALDVMESIAEKDAGASNGAAVARLKNPDWSEE